MKQKTIYFLLILLFCFCKEENNKPVNIRQFLFTDSLTGTNLLHNPEENASIIKVIPHATRVEILPENPSYTIQKEITLKWRKIKHGSEIGWVIDSNLSDKVERHYFSVVTNSGLPLREKPDPKSKIISIIPLGYIGEFFNQSKENVIIKGQPGFWMETFYNGKNGWIFSGFTAISKNLQSLEERNGDFGDASWFYRFYSNIEETKLEEIEFDPKSIEKTGTLVKSENYPYTIYQIQRQVAEDDCNGKESQVVFKNNLTGKSYANREIFLETIVEQNHPLNRTVYTNSVPQKCGCLIENSTLYFLFEDRVLAAPFRNVNTSAFCDYGPVSNVEIERENRYDFANNTIYMYLRLPDCQPDEKILLYGGKITDIKKFKTDMFISLHLTNEEVQVEKFYQKGIPEKFKPAWDNASKEPSAKKD